MRNRTWRRAGLVVLIAASAVRAGAQSGPPDWEWPTRGADLANTRYAPLNQIDASNFDSLELAWRFGTANLGPRPDYRWQTTPLVANGVMYTTAGSRRAVVALDARTGGRIPSFGVNGSVDLRLEMDQTLDPVTGDVSLRTPPMPACCSTRHMARG